MPVLQTGLAKSAATGYDIEQSLRFEDGDSAYLSSTPPTDSSTGRKTWTLSWWEKKTTPNNGYVYSQGTSGNNIWIGPNGSDGKLWVRETTSGGEDVWGWKVDSYARDSSAWYHFLVAVDTTQSDSADRVKIYINGVQQTLTAAGGGAPSLNLETELNNNTTRYIGTYKASSSYKDGYLAEFHLIDGTALTPASFGETNSATNQWVPIEYTGSYGTNGFYQKYGGTELAASFADSDYHNVHTVTAVGDVHTDTTVKKFGTASAQFDGTGDQLTMPYSTDWAQMAYEKDFTLDFWMYPTDRTPGDAIMSCQASGKQTFEINFINDSPPLIRYAAWDGGAWTNVDSAEVGADAWHHYAIVRSNGYFTTYVDGVPGTAVADPGDLISEPGATFNIGASYYGTAYEGYIDEVRLSDTARWTSDFSASLPSSAYTADVNTLLLLHMDGSDGGTTFTDSSWVGVGTPGHRITANGDVTNTRAQSKVGDSSIKFDGTGDYLSLADSSDWDFSGDFTVEGWFRTNNASAEQTIFGTEVTHTNDDRWAFWMSSGGKLGFFTRGDETTAQGATTLSADTWYHIAAVRSGSTVKLWLNGAEDASFTDGTSLVADGLVVGCWYTGGTSSFMNGYLDELRISNSARYTGAFTPSTTAFTADANTKLLIHSDFDGGLGADSSGNANDFTPTNLVATDQMVDTPNNNWCTLNPLDVTSTGGTYSEGNLKFTTTSAGTGRGVSTFRPDSGKWYGEFYVVDATRFSCGVMNKNGEPSSQGGLSTNSAIFFYNKNAYYNGAEVLNYLTSTLSNGDIISFALDLDNTILWYGINGTWQQSATEGEIEAGTSTNSFTTFISSTNPISSDVGIFIEDNSGSAAMSGVANFGQDSSFAGNVTAQGNQDGNGIGDFYYEPPSGFNSLCSENLPSPEIALPTAHFNTILYTGDGATTLAVTGVGFQPDFTWIKNRSATDKHILVDSVRGANKYLSSNNTDAEVDDSTFVASLDSDGFTVGDDVIVNTSGENYASWNWLAGGGAGSSNTDGATATTSTSVNTTGGFSISTLPSYSGNTTFGHGLSAAPTLVIMKAMSGIDQWTVGHSGLGSWGKGIPLNTTAAEQTNSTFFNDLAPDATIVNLGAWDAGYTRVVYCFHEVEGYSKFGSYTGNENADGTFVYTGFRPAYFLQKRADATASWLIYDDKRDPYNEADTFLRANSNEAGDSGVPIDIVSNGFKIRSSNTSINGSGGTMLYLAFAESPFKYANAR